MWDAGGWEIHVISLHHKCGTPFHLCELQSLLVGKVGYNIFDYTHSTSPVSFLQERMLSHFLCWLLWYSPRQKLFDIQASHTLQLFTNLFASVANLRFKMNSQLLKSEFCSTLGMKILTASWFLLCCSTTACLTVISKINAATSAAVPSFAMSRSPMRLKIPFKPRMKSLNFWKSASIQQTWNLLRKPPLWCVEKPLPCWFLTDFQTSSVKWVLSCRTIILTYMIKWSHHM